MGNVIPCEPWYAILNKILPHLLVEPFRTFDLHYEEQCEGWGRLVHCLNEHAPGLSLPAGAGLPVEVWPTEVRHKFWLQECFDALSGIGQDEELLRSSAQIRRVEDLLTLALNRQSMRPGGELDLFDRARRTRSTEARQTVSSRPYFLSNRGTCEAWASDMPVTCNGPPHQQ